MTNTKKIKVKTRTSLKQKINKYILKNKDICCEKDIKRDIVIEQIFENYKQIFTNPNEKEYEYLNWLNNDLIGFIGIKQNLERDKDTEGVKLWKEIDKKTSKNKRGDKEKIMLLLNEIPLYYLLAFSGQSFYKYKEWQAYN